MRTGVSGFTLIELIAGIVIAGVLATVIMPRFAAPGAYDRAILRDQIISSARAAQQKALGRRDVTLVLQPQGAELDLSISDDHGLVQAIQVPMRGIAIHADADVAASCAIPGTGLTAGNPLLLDYAMPGDLKAAQGVPVSQSVRICLDGDPELSVCIASTGFAYAGDCRL